MKNKRLLFGSNFGNRLMICPRFAPGARLGSTPALAARLISAWLLGAALLAAGCAKPLHPLVAGEPERATPAQLRAFDAAALDGEEERAKVRETLADVLRRALGNDAAAVADEELAVEALIVLGQLEPPAEEALAVARPPLGNPESPRTVRYAALRLLASHGASERVRAAVEPFLQDSDPLLAGEARMILQ